MTPGTEKLVRKCTTFYNNDTSSPKKDKFSLMSEQKEIMASTLNSFGNGIKLLP